MNTRAGELIFFWIIFGVIGFLAWSVMSSYLIPVFLGAVCAIALSPLHLRMLTLTEGKETLAAFLTILLLFCVILIPLLFFAIFLFQEAVSAYNSLASGSSLFSFIDHTLGIVASRLQTFLPSFEIHANFSAYAQSTLGWIADHLNDLFANVLAFSFQSFIFLISLFLLCRDGGKLRTLAITWSPLREKYTEKMFMTIADAVDSIIKGALLSSCVQGVLVGGSFAFFGIVNPLLFGTLAAIAALLPPLGSAIVTVPVAIFMLLAGHYGVALGLLLSGIVVGLIDNIIRPMILRQGINIHPFIVLLSVIGGIAHFGPVGVIVGPVMISAFVALLRIYPEVVLQDNNAAHCVITKS